MRWHGFSASSHCKRHVTKHLKSMHRRSQLMARRSEEARTMRARPSMFFRLFAPRLSNRLGTHLRVARAGKSRTRCACWKPLILREWLLPETRFSARNQLYPGLWRKTVIIFFRSRTTKKTCVRRLRRPSGSRFSPSLNGKTHPEPRAWTDRVAPHRSAACRGAL